jgi:hypothetical protein
MDAQLKSGQRFRFRVLSDPPSPEREAVVVQVRSDRQEGLSPEIDAYVAFWVEAKEISGPDPAKQLFFALATDEHWYLEGKSTEITPIS